MVTKRVTGDPGPGRTFTADVTAAGTARLGYDTFRRGWERQVGASYPAPAFAPGSNGDFRISARAVKADDTVIADVHSESMIGTNSAAAPDDDQVMVHVVERGAWHFTRAADGELAVPTGHFLIQRTGPATLEVARRTAAKVLILPASAIGPLMNDRLITGSAASPEMRLLLAHVHLVAETAQDLGPGGARAAHNAVVELLKGVLRQRPDTTEPALAPALARAAQDLADRRLADPDLSPATLARHLGVSVRTLHRAFAGTEESVAGYIRRRRLEQARADLLAGRSSVSDLAAHWQFADNSHFTRAFKRVYGRTPSEYAREHRDPAQP